MPVTAVVLDAHGTRPPGRFADALVAKRKLVWNNARRNRRVAAVARRLATGTRKAVRSVVGDRELVDAIVPAARTGVAVLVETPAHARELAALLPGWVVWAAYDERVIHPKAGSGVIVTELAAAETVIRAGVLVRATGTRHPLPEIDWPRRGAVGAASWWTSRTATTRSRPRTRPRG